MPAVRMTNVIPAAKIAFLETRRAILKRLEPVAKAGGHAATVRAAAGVLRSGGGGGLAPSGGPGVGGAGRGGGGAGAGGMTNVVPETTFYAGPHTTFERSTWTRARPIPTSAEPEINPAQIDS